jgi:competence protein ComEA
MFPFLTFLLVAAAVWLLWGIARNTADGLDKQTALQYEVVALEKRLDEIVDLLQAQGSSAHGNQHQDSQKPLVLEVAEPVDLNRAEIKDLITLPKIGKALAQRIIEQRPYGSVEDLLNVSGISPELLEQIRPQACV